MVRILWQSFEWALLHILLGFLLGHCTPPPIRASYNTTRGRESVESLRLCLHGTCPQKTCAQHPKMPVEDCAGLVLGAVTSFLEPLLGHLSPKVAKVEGALCATLCAPPPPCAQHGIAPSKLPYIWVGTSVGNSDEHTCSRHAAWGSHTSVGPILCVPPAS